MKPWEQLRAENDRLQEQVERLLAWKRRATEHVEDLADAIEGLDELEETPRPWPMHCGPQADEESEQ